MATPGHSKAARAYYNAFRVSQVVSGGGFEIAQDTVEVPILEDAYKTYIAGKPGANNLSLAGFLDVAENGWDQLVDNDRANARNYIGWYPTGTAIGSIAYEFNALDTGEARAFDQAGVVGLSWTGQPTDLFYRGLAITGGEQAVTGTGALTGQNIGVTTSTQSKVVCIRVVSVTGTPGSVAFQIYGSSDDGSGDAYAQITGWSNYTTEGLVSVASDTATFTGIGAVWLYKTGVTEAWQRLQVTTFATFTSISVQASAGVAAIG